MKYFEATLIARGKKEVHNFMAVDRREAMTIAQSGGMVVQVREMSMPIGAQVASWLTQIQEKFFVASIGQQEWIVAMRQMGVMLQAGMSLSDSIKECASATQDKRARAIMLKALDDVEAGFSLSASFEKNKEAIGNISMALVTLGEKTGTLAESMLKLADMVEELRNNRAKVKKAVRMPAITLIAMAGAFVVMIMVVIPKFKNIFDKIGSDLPMSTQMLINAEWLFRNYGLFIVIGIAGVVMLHKWAMQTRPTYKLGVDRYMLRVYLIGNMLSLGFFSRFMMIFAQLIRSGIPLTDAMGTAGGTIENSYVRQKLTEASHGIGQGKQLSTALDETGLFEPMVLQMIRSGESSGELDAMLGRVGDYYKMRFDNLIDNFSALLEPIMMLFLAGLVLMMAMGILLPMWSLGDAMKGRKR